MAELFQIVNAGQDTGLPDRRRLWLEPGRPMVALPGLYLVASVDVSDGAHAMTVESSSDELAASRAGWVYQFRVLPRAVHRRNGAPWRVFVEVGYARLKSGRQAHN